MLIDQIQQNWPCWKLTEPKDNQCQSRNEILDYKWLFADRSLIILQSQPHDRDHREADSSQETEYEIDFSFCGLAFDEKSKEESHAEWDIDKPIE